MEISPSTNKESASISSILCVRSKVRTWHGRLRALHGYSHNECGSHWSSVCSLAVYENRSCYATLSDNKSKISVWLHVNMNCLKFLFSCWFLLVIHHFPLHLTAATLRITNSEYLRHHGWLKGIHSLWHNCHRHYNINLQAFPKEDTGMHN